MVTQRAVGSVESSVHPAKLSEGEWVAEEAEDGCERRAVGARHVNVNLMCGRSHVQQTSSGSHYVRSSSKLVHPTGSASCCPGRISAKGDVGGDDI